MNRIGIRNRRSGDSARLLITMVFLLGISASAVAGNVDVHGDVTFSDGSPAIAAVVTLSSATFVRQVVADDQGAYSVEDVPDGTYGLVVTAWAVGKAEMAVVMDLVLSDKTRPLRADVFLDVPAE